MRAADPQVPVHVPKARAKPPAFWNFAAWYLLGQTLFPALLYLPGSQRFRVEIRVASYGISLAVLFYVWFIRNAGPNQRPHPSAPFLAAAVAYLGLMFFHPNSNTPMACAAQIALYLAIMAPIFWAHVFVRSATQLRRLLWLILFCSGVNSFVGVMQVRDPDRWMPREFSSVFTESDLGLATVTYTGANGRTIIRPPGLGDAPGAVANPAIVAFYLGLVFIVEDRRWWRKILAGLFSLLGAAAAFLSLVRSCVIIAGIMIILHVVLLVIQRRHGQALLITALAAAGISIAFFRTSALGGDTLVDRFQSVFAERPSDFYEENRGNQVAFAFTEILPRYPLGAGLGRWGMMSYYFGDPTKISSSPIWVEVQIPAWIVDGGIVLLILYPVALVVALWNQAKLALQARDKDVRSLASMILILNIGVVALCFDYTAFLASEGVQFWFLSGALYGVAVAHSGRRRAKLRGLKRPLLKAVGRPA